MADLPPTKPDANGAGAGASGDDAVGTIAPAPPYSKRRRRPSVRLGDIGGNSAATDLPLRRHPKPSSHPRPPRRTHADENLDPLAAAAASLPRATKPPPRRARSSWLPASVSADAADGYGGEEEEEPYDYDEEQSDSAAAAAAARVRFSDSRDASPGFGGDDSDGAADWGLPNGRYRLPGDGGVKAWLGGLGLARYAPVFEVHEVDDEVLPLLTLEDLKDMGIGAVGSRRKMYAAIQKLRRNNIG